MFSVLGVVFVNTPCFEAVSLAVMRRVSNSAIVILMSDEQTPKINTVAFS